MSNQTTIFIRTLPPNTTDKDIRDSFSIFGKIVDIQFTRNQSVKVAFSKHEEAQKAINEQKNIHVRGKGVRVIWNHGSLMLSNLPPRIKEDELKKCLSKFPIVDIQLRPKQEALVTFENQTIATDVMAQLNGFSVNGYQITAKVFHSQPKIEYVPLPSYITFTDKEEQPELPPNAYASLKVNGGYVIFYPPDLAPQPTPSAEAGNQGQPASSEIKNITKVRVDVYNEAFRYLEERTVYVEGFKPETTQEEINAYFSQCGRIIDLKKHLSKAEIIQYETVEARNKALKLSKSTLPNQKYPLAVLPFFNKAIPHKDSGLLQINELPPTTSVESLTAEFSEFGNIIAVSISPIGFDEFPYGLILFQLFDQAKNAKQAKTSEKYPNIFLYPPLHTHDSILAFTESPVAPNNCLVIYDLPMTTYEPEINQKCREYGYIKSSFVLTDGKSKAAYIYFTTPSNAVDAYYQLTNDKAHVDLLNGNALLFSSQRLRDITLPAEWNNLLIFLQGLPLDYGTSKLRNDLMSINLNFDSCFVNIYPITGSSNQTGIILLRDRQQAMWLLQNMNSVIKGVNATLFRSKGGYSPTANPNASQNSPYKFPPQQRRPLSPREWLRQFIELNFPEDVQFHLIPKLQQLSIYETQTMAMNFPYFLSWIQNNNIPK